MPDPAHCDCPAFRCIVAASDLTPGSKRAFRKALALSRDLGAHLHLLHVVPVPPVRSVFFLSMGSHPTPDTCARTAFKARKRLEDFLRGERLGDVAFTSAVRTGVPHREVLVYLAEVGADLLVVGERPETRPQHLLQHFLFESVGERLRRIAPCPVLTVR